MTVSISCCLCFSFGLTFKCLADDNGQFNNIYKIAIKYFKPELSKSQEELCSAVICLKCWDHINEFYIFQQLIRSTQSQIKKCIPIILIYQEEHKLNTESAPTQPLYLASSSLDYDNGEIHTNKVDFKVSPTPIDIQNNFKFEFNNDRMPCNNVDKLVPNSVGISKNPNLTSAKCTEKKSKKIVQRHTINAKIDEFHCVSCHIKFSNTRKLKYHLNKYHNISLTCHDMDYRCEKCKHITFCSFDSLKRHMKQKHHVVLFLKKIEKPRNKQAKHLEISEKEPLKEMRIVDEEIRCKTCKYLTFPCFANLRKHKKTQHHVVNFQNKYTKIKKAQTRNHYDVQCKSLVLLPTSLKQSVELKPIGKAELLPVNNYTTTKANENKSLPVINVDKDPPELLFEESSIIHRRRPSKQLQPFTLTISSTENKNPEIINKNIQCLNSPSPVLVHTSNQENLIDPPSGDAKAVINIVDDTNIKYNSTMKKATDIQSVEHSKSEIKVDGKIRCGICECITFANLTNFKKHMETIHQFKSILDHPCGDTKVVVNDVDDINIKYNSTMKKPTDFQTVDPFKSEINFDGKIRCKFCKYLTFSNFANFKRHMEKKHHIFNLRNKYNIRRKKQSNRNFDAIEQSVHIKPNISNNTVINPTKNQSVQHINPITYIDKAISVLIMEDTKNRRQQTDSSEVDKIDFVPTIRNNRNIQLQSFNSPTSSPGYNNRNTNRLEPSGDAEMVANVVDINEKIYSTMTKLNEDQSLELPSKAKKNKDYRCEECKHLKFSCFMDLKGHMKLKHQIDNFQNTYKKSKETAASKNYDVQFPPLITSPQLLVQASNCSIIKATEKQSVPITNPISDVDRVTEEFVMKDTIITAQQTNYSEANCVATIINNHPKEDVEVVANVVDINNKYSTMARLNDGKLLEPPSKAQKNKDYRCEECKHLKFSCFMDLKGHMKLRHQIVNFQNTYKKSKETAASKNYDVQFLPLITSPQSEHGKHNEDAKLVKASNFTIIKTTEKQSVLTVNPILDVDRVTEELVMKDTRITAQQTNYSEANGVATLANNYPKRDDKVVVFDNINIKYNSIINKTTGIQSVESFKDEINFDGKIRCEMCKYSTFSNFANLKRHMKNKHHIINFQNKYKKRKKIQANKDYDAPHQPLISLRTSQEQSRHTKPNENAKLVHISNNDITNSTETINRIANVDKSTTEFITEDKSKKLVKSKKYHVEFQPLTTSSQLDHGEHNEDSEFLANDVTINKKCTYNLRKQNYQMYNCAKMTKKCETNNVDEPLQQLNQSTKFLHQLSHAELQDNAKIEHNGVNKNNECNSAVMNQKTLGKEPKNYFQYDLLENLIKKQISELNTTKKQTSKPKKSFSPDGIDNFIKMSIGNLKCTICERIFCYYSLLNEHFNLKHPNKKCFVNCCGNEVINRRNLVHHLKKHVDKTMSNDYDRNKKHNSIDEEAKMSVIIQADPVLAITSVISAQPIESVNDTSIDESSLSSRATTMGKSPIKQCNYCSRTFKYVTSLMKHINHFHSGMRNDFNLNQYSDNRNLSIKSDKGFF